MNRSALNGSIWPVAILAALICLAVFAPAYYCDFVNWDDQDYVSNNAAIRSLDWNLIRWAFTETYLGWWMPLTWLSFAVDYALWGLNPSGYHLTNILLHAANTGLVVLITERLMRVERGGMRDTADERRGMREGKADERRGMRDEDTADERGELRDERKTFSTLITQHSSASSILILLLAGLLWGIHPMRVESVAWVTERKDVLNGLFSLLALLNYLKYARSRETAAGGDRRCYWLSILFFAFSLLAKSVSVVMPVVLLILDWYPLQRVHRTNWRRILLEKVPYLILSLAMSAVTLGLSIQDNTIVLGLSLAQRLQISGNALFEYGRLLAFPVDIIPLYIIPDPIPPSYLTKSVVALVVIIALLAVWKRYPAVTVTLLLFLLPVLPTLAFTQNGIQSMAMRFTYLPSLALAIALSMLLYKSLVNREKGAVTGVFLCCFLLLAVYGVGTLRQIGVWKDSASMWSRVIQYQPFDRAFFYRGLHYADKGWYEAAVADYSTTLAIAEKERLPGVHNIRAYRGEALIGAGRYQEALMDLSFAITASPQPLYYYYRSIAYRELGMLAEATADLARAGTASGKMQWF